MRKLIGPSGVVAAVIICVLFGGSVRKLWGLPLWVVSWGPH
jgi:hypothetical protein